ncbi:MAG TPA: DUF3131 domain-containing protein [Paracoccaceae bacterium]|nr:DUF3131 domain-containing protein [Paracoccaceae bacterium]
MRINRRLMLQLAGALGVGATLPAPLGAQSAAPRGLFLLVDRIGPGVPEAALRAFLEPLGQSMIPVALALDPAADPAVVRMVGGAAAELPDLFEIVVRIDGLAAMQPYFQMRAAATARAAVERAVLDAGMAPAQVPPLMSAVTDLDGPLVPLDALRAAGLRNVLVVTPGAGWTQSVVCDGGTLCLQGGLALAPGSAAGRLGDRLDRPGPQGEFLLAVLSAPDLTGAGIETIRADAEALALRIVRGVQGGTVFVVPPREHLAWFDGTRGRTVALRLALPPAGDTAAEAGFADLRAGLDAGGWPYSVSGPDGADDPGLCPEGADAAALADRIALREAVCAAGAPSASEARMLAQAGLGVLAGPTAPGLPRVDDDGMIRVPETTGPDDWLQGPRGADVVLALTAQTYRDANLRARVLAALRAAGDDPTTQRARLADYAAALIPADPVFALLRETRAHQHRARAAPPQAPDAEALRADAAHAWAFVAANTEGATGLCPATVHHQPDGTSYYRILTMWDLGSLIRGTMAAHELGLMTDGEFADRATALVRALPATRIDGAVLPNELIASDRIATLSDDFNICDTGRLLGALRDLDRHPLVPGIAAPAVARWDLARMVPDGRPQSILRGRRVDSLGSHCTHYTARAFGAWGIAMQSPYAVAQAGSATDVQMRVLHAAAGIGALGAEPLLMEAIETGLSAPSALLADVLEAAQLRFHAATGQFVCVSESPLDRAPWFAYAGLRLNDAARRWDVRANTNDPAHQTDQFRQDTMVLNTKAAFLWAALRPGATSLALLDHLRRRARVEQGGFSPGLYAATGLGMPGYADLNTNAVILEAAAHVLRGGLPRLPPG